MNGQRYRHNIQHLLHTKEQWYGNIGRQHLEDDYNTEEEGDQDSIHDGHSDNVTGVYDENDQDNVIDSDNVSQSDELVSSERVNIRPVINLTKFDMNKALMLNL